MGGARKEPKQIIYSLIYREGGERKVRRWEMIGQTTGKRFKEWNDDVIIQSSEIVKRDGVEFLASSWKGFEKRRSG